MSYKITEEVLNQILEDRKRRFTYKELSEKYGFPTATIQYNILARTGRPRFERKCALLDCDVVFNTSNQLRRFCSRLHAKVHGMREVEGREIIRSVCALPECDVPTLTRVNKGKKPRLFDSSEGRFCSRAHNELHWRRVNSGWYKKLLGEFPCEVCGHRFAIDEHHEVFDWKSGSDLDGPTHWLCATHHAMIHRGYAEYRDGKYVDLTEILIEQSSAKAELFDAYFGDK